MNPYKRPQSAKNAEATNTYKSNSSSNRGGFQFSPFGTRASQERELRARLQRDR